MKMKWMDLHYVVRSDGIVLNNIVYNEFKWRLAFNDEAGYLHFVHRRDPITVLWLMYDVPNEPGSRAMFLSRSVKL